MGMYTELVIKCKVKKQLPVEVKNIINYLFNSTGDILNPPDCLPQHKFFTLERWHWVGKGSSVYHIPFSLSKYEENYLFSRSDLKNYCGEIEEFLDWFNQYIDEPEDTCIGWTWYEEVDKPTLIFKQKC